MPTVSVNIITKDQVESTARCVASLRSFLRPGDEVLIANTGRRGYEALRDACRAVQTPDTTLKVHAYHEKTVDFKALVEKYVPERAGEFEADPQYSDGEGITDFAAARDFLRKRSKNDYIFWIDSDDVLVEETPGALRNIFEEYVGPGKPHEVLFLDYWYAFSENGTLTTMLRRERLIPREKYEWRGACHETLCPLNGEPGPVGYCETLKSRIQHMATRKGSRVSDIRNYVILRLALEKEEKNGQADPRTILYLANAARGLSRVREAVKLYKRFDGLSGSADDRFCAAHSIAHMYMSETIQRPVEGGDWFQKCVDILPRDPRGYFGISRAYFAQHRYQEALDWYEHGLRYPFPQTMMSVNPLEITTEPHLVAALAAHRLKQFDLAEELCRRALKATPDRQDALDLLKFLGNQASGAALASALTYVGQHVQGGGPNTARVLKKALEEMPACPPQLEEIGIGKPEMPDPREPRPEVVIFCGRTLEPWGPRSAETGIGGSEKMVILIAGALQERGVNVTVYADVPVEQRGVYPNGVRWQHFSEATPRKVHTLVAWRAPQYLSVPFGAQRRILWLHDVPRGSDYTDAVIATVDAIFVASQYHADCLPASVPRSKVHVLRNAIVDDWPEFDAAKKDPFKVVFLSSPDRGLATALEAFLLAKSKEPRLSFEVLYGFTPYERAARAHCSHRAIPDIGRDACVDDYERYVGRLIDDAGANYHRRVSFKKVQEILETAGMWVYPTRFTEISCMAAMEAQASGVIPITSGLAALAETVLSEDVPHLCYKVDPNKREEIANAILYATGEDAASPARAKLAARARERFGLGALADQWLKVFGIQTSGVKV